MLSKAMPGTRSPTSLQRYSTKTASIETKYGRLIPEVESLTPRMQGLALCGEDLFYPFFGECCKCAVQRHRGVARELPIVWNEKCRSLNCSLFIELSEGE